MVKVLTWKHSSMIKFASTTPFIMAGFTIDSSMMMETDTSDNAITDACLELSYKDVEMVKGLSDPQHLPPPYCQTISPVLPTYLCPLFPS